MSKFCNEDAVNSIGNRYDLILVASQRARELSRGDLPLVEKPSKSHITTAMMEIESGYVDRTYLYKIQDRKSRSHHRKY